jgi:hypothetical protein
VYIKACHTGFSVPKKGEKLSDSESAVITTWCKQSLLGEAYRSTLADPYGQPAFVTTVAVVLCNSKTSGGQALTKARVTVQQLALVSLKVREVLLG